LHDIKKTDLFKDLYEAFVELGEPPIYTISKKELTQSQHASKNESFVGYAEFLNRFFLSIKEN
jgi:hypothetical protein